jgi:hypothetical protein
MPEAVGIPQDGANGGEKNARGCPVEFVMTHMILASVPTLNLLVAWGAILAGLVSGTVIGLFFDREDWLGGYASWRRRLLRLGHIAFFGTGLLNLAFALTNSVLGLVPVPFVSSVLFVVGAVTMPAVCFLAAWRKPWRHLFFIPVLSLIGAVGSFLFRLLGVWEG